MSPRFSKDSSSSFQDISRPLSCSPISTASLVITVNMRTTLGLTLLLTLVLLTNAIGPQSGNDDDGGDDDDDNGHPVQGAPSAAMALTPTIFTANHDGVGWSALALTGVALAMYGA